VTHSLVVLLIAQSFHVFLDGQPRMAVVDALHEASDLLSQPSCGAVFDDFHNTEGRPLSDILRAADRTPREWLSVLYFVEGDSARCRADMTMTAYTKPGSRVVWICGQTFSASFSMAVKGGAYIIIHEMLHTVGLGENPPSSAEITAVVARRCRR